VRRDGKADGEDLADGTFIDGRWVESIRSADRLYQMIEIAEYSTMGARWALLRPTALQKLAHRSRLWRNHAGTSFDHRRLTYATARQ
jgi:hypothetical protein